MKRKNRYSNSTIETGWFFLLLSFLIIPISIFIYTGVNAFNDFKQFPAQPQHIALAEASSLLANQQKIWVVIDDIQWDCNHIFHKEYRSSRGIPRSTYTTHILFTNKRNNVWGLTYFPGELSCDEVIQQEKDAIGVLQWIAEDQDICLQNGCEIDSPSFLMDNGFDISRYETGGKFLWFCHDCGGRDTAIRNLLLSGGMILIFLLSIFVVLFWRF